MWNYRMVKFEGEEGIFITEVYYDKLIRPDGFIHPNKFNPMYGEDIEDLKLVYKNIQHAFVKPIVIIKDNQIIREESLI